MGKQTVRYSEDCLNLNIWAPHHASHLPVLVFFHGGSYNTGSNSDPIFSGEEFCSRNVIPVTVNYRLNAFSCACDETHSGNYGLWDQIAALQWIHENIEDFGGDPTRVTVSGESAGAMSVQNLMYAPQAHGLMCSAIMMSGGGILKNNLFAVGNGDIAKQAWQHVCEKLGAVSEEEMKGRPAREIFQAWQSVTVSVPALAAASVPYVDGVLIPDTPERLLQNKRINDIPCIVGFLSEDMWSHTLACAAVKWGIEKTKPGMAPVYGYYFDRAAPGCEYGAFHGADLWYLFGRFELNWRNYTAID